MAGIVSSRILEKACDWSNEKYDECKIALVVWACKSLCQFYPIFERDHGNVWQDWYRGAIAVVTFLWGHNLTITLSPIWKFTFFYEH